MPNYCDYDIRIRGKQKNVQKLLNWLNAEYHYERDGRKGEVFLLDGDKKLPVEHHIGYRVFSCNYDEEFLKSVTANDSITIYAYGDVAWSVASTMLDGPCSYLGDYSFFKKSPLKEKNIFKLIKQNIIRRKAISLPKACKKLHLEVEINSKEPGMGFSEHYYINSKGKLVVDEEHSYFEWWIDEYENYQDLIAEYSDAGNQITKEQFDDAKLNDKRYIEVCDSLDEYGEFKFQYVV